MEHETYTCLIWEPSWVSVSLHDGRRLSEEEKSGYSAEYRDKMFFGVGESTELKHITSADLPRRESDGCFPATNNMAWILSAEEKGYYLGLEKGRAEAEAAAEAAEEKRRVEELKRYEARRERALKGVEWTTEKKEITDEGGKTVEYIHHITVNGKPYDLVERSVFDVGRVINPLKGDGLALSRLVWERFRSGAVLMEPEEERAVRLVLDYGKFASSPIRM